MPREERHPEDALLDAARRIVCEQGARAATVAAIAGASRAPTGSIYHRFASVDELLARLWIRAVRRTHAAVLEAPGSDDPLQRAVDAALATYDFCLGQREDARVLAAFGTQAFLEANLPAELHVELKHLNEPVMEPLRAIARGIFGHARRGAVDVTLAAIIDLPYGLARRYLEDGEDPPPERRTQLEAAVRAMLTV